MDITAHKKILREKLIKQRNSIDRNDIVRASDKIYSKLISLDIINEAKTVMVYVSFASEVMTHEFIKYLINKKTTVLTPVCVSGGHMIAAKTQCFPEGFEENKYGILEIPLKKAVSVEADEIDVVIVPAVSYATDGRRLGYGGGYYDRFIEKLNDKAITIGILMDEMICEQIPIDSHDKKADIILTQTLSIFKGRY